MRFLAGVLVHAPRARAGHLPRFDQFRSPLHVGVHVIRLAGSHAGHFVTKEAVLGTQFVGQP